MVLFVDLSLPRGAVYLAGEEVRCIVSLTNSSRDRVDGSDAAVGVPYPSVSAAASEDDDPVAPSTDPTSPRPATPSKPLPDSDRVVIAWASIQIHGLAVVVDAKPFRPPATRHAPSETEVSSTADLTSFAPNKGERGRSFYASEPKILCCEMLVDEEETVVLEYREKLPYHLPPTFKGHCIRYMYKVTLGIQCFGSSATRHMRLPFRVLTLEGLQENMRSLHDSASDEDEEKITPTSNPFLMNISPKVEVLETANRILTSITARRSPNSYNISHTNGGKVGKFTLLKHAFKLGEDIVGLFDMTDATVTCVQYLVSLQCEEEPSQDILLEGVCSSAHLQVSTHARQRLFCLHVASSSVSLPIPLHATPTFVSDSVCLRWKLHFEFVTAPTSPPDEAFPANEDGAVVENWVLPAKLQVETMVWDLPIKIYPTDPIQVMGASSVVSSKLLAIR